VSSAAAAASSKIKKSFEKKVRELQFYAANFL
jgi:hypothetical protein